MKLRKGYTYSNSVGSDVFGERYGSTREDAVQFVKAKRDEGFYVRMFAAHGRFFRGWNVMWWSKKGVRE